MKTTLIVLVEGVTFAACVLMIGFYCFGLLPALFGSTLK